MSDRLKTSGDSDVPLAVVKKSKGMSLIWVVPLVAMVIAAGLVYKAVTQKGQTITITFRSAEGLEAGKTQIKHKDVVVGRVEKIAVSPDLKGVIITAELIKESEDYLTENTRFWVVRARFTGGIATGLSTLFSGGYIAIDPRLEGKKQTDFIGLEIPPVVTSDTPGRHFLLKADRLGSLAHGSPVHFKGVQVGQVAGYRFTDDSGDLEIKIFIEAPYDNNVRESTRFWFASGLDMVMDDKGIRIDTQSFASMMIGGLSFANPVWAGKGDPAKDGATFPLYDSLEDAAARRYVQKEYYLLRFQDSVRGLDIGSSVEFRGFQLGRVVDIGLEMGWNDDEMKIPVKIEVAPEQVRALAGDIYVPENSLQRLVERGLRAQLKTGNLLTGRKYVTIDMLGEPGTASLKKYGDLVEIPTIPAVLAGVTDDLSALLDRLAQIPMEEISDAVLDAVESFEQTGKSLTRAGDGITEIISSAEIKRSVVSLEQALEQINRLSGKLEQDLPEAVTRISGEAVSTMEGVQTLTAKDSDVIIELKRTLAEFSRAARHISRLADQLERHPESLIQGKGKE